MEAEKGKKLLSFLLSSVCMQCICTILYVRTYTFLFLSLYCIQIFRQEEYQSTIVTEKAQLRCPRVVNGMLMKNKHGQVQ